MSAPTASPHPHGDSQAKNYVPVSCSFHDRLEDAAVRRLVYRVAFQDEHGETRRVDTTIDDVWSREGEEFARLGTGDVVRLDRLELGDRCPGPWSVSGPGSSSAPGAGHG